MGWIGAELLVSIAQVDRIGMATAVLLAHQDKFGTLLQVRVNAFQGSSGTVQPASLHAEQEWLV